MRRDGHAKQDVQWILLLVQERDDIGYYDGTPCGAIAVIAVPVVANVAVLGGKQFQEKDELLREIPKTGCLCWGLSCSTNDCNGS